MPQGKWTAKDERRYEAILESCSTSKTKRRNFKTCQRIAAATVNKFRSKRKRKGVGCSCQPGQP
jgi:hypothetical protein